MLEIKGDFFSSQEFTFEEFRFVESQGIISLESLLEKILCKKSNKLVLFNFYCYIVWRIYRTLLNSRILVRRLFGILKSKRRETTGCSSSPNSSGFVRL